MTIIDFEQTAKGAQKGGLGLILRLRRGKECASKARVTDDWLMAAVEKRLREQLAELQVEINERDEFETYLRRGEFGFLGFDFRRMRSRRGVWRVKCHAKVNKLQPPCCGSSKTCSAATSDAAGFEVLPKRWIFERTFAWISVTVAWLPTSNATQRPLLHSSASP